MKNKILFILLLFVIQTVILSTNTISAQKLKPTDVPADVVQTLEEQYSYVKVTGWLKEGGTYIANIKDGLDCDVTLSDYTQIGFDGNLFGKLEWDEVDCSHAATSAAVPAALVPVEIANYVSKIHGTQSITKISKDNRGWDIKLSNGIEIEFDKRFNVIDFDD